MNSVNEVLLAIALIMGITLCCVCITGMFITLLGYKIAKLYAPTPRETRRVPGLGEISAMAMDDPDVIRGVNGYPDQDGDGAENTVAERPELTQVAVAAEGTIAQDRDDWWEQLREEGYKDDEIAQMERSGVVPVFEEA